MQVGWPHANRQLILRPRHLITRKQRVREEWIANYGVFAYLLDH